MKWHELKGLSEGALLVHIGGGRRAIFLAIDELKRMILIRYLDSPTPELANPSEFVVAQPPKSTVARGTL